MPRLDLDREADRVRRQGARLQTESWIAGTQAPARVAAYVAASEHVERMSAGQVVEVVKQGLDAELVESEDKAVRALARDVLVKRVGA